MHDEKYLNDVHFHIAQYNVDVFKKSFIRYSLRNINLVITLDDLKRELPIALEQVA